MDVHDRRNAIARSAGAEGMKAAMRIVVLLLGCAIAADTGAQTLFFTDPPTPPHASPPYYPPAGFIEAEYPISIDVRRLVQGDAARQQWIVVLPDGRSIPFELRTWDYSSGFIETGDVRPDPDLPDEDLSYSWFGTYQNLWMQAWVDRGALSAAIVTVEYSYSVSQAPGYQMMKQSSMRIRRVFRGNFEAPPGE
jgi:hypothetical protein